MTRAATSLGTKVATLDHAFCMPPWKSTANGTMLSLLQESTSPEVGHHTRQEVARVGCEYCSTTSFPHRDPGRQLLSPRRTPPAPLPINPQEADRSRASPA